MVFLGGGGGSVFCPTIDWLKMSKIILMGRKTQIQRKKKQEMLFWKILNAVENLVIIILNMCQASTKCVEVKQLT